MKNLHIYNIGRVVLAVVFLCILAAVALKDIKTRKIPDSLVLSLGFCGLFSVPFFPEIGLPDRVSGMLSVSLWLLVVTFIVPGSFGGGDIKLMAAAGIFLGWKGCTEAFVIAVMLCGIYCVTMLGAGRIKRKSHIAFGPFLCAGLMAEMVRMIC